MQVIDFSVLSQKKKHVIWQAYLAFFKPALLTNSYLRDRPASLSMQFSYQSPQ